MPSIDLAGSEIEYTVRHSTRATRARIDIDVREITVVIPEKMNLEPQTFLREKQSWVLEKKKKFDEYLDRVPDRSFEEGASFPYLDRPHTIEIRDTKTKAITEGRIVLRRDRLKKESIQEQIESLYREEARKVIREKLQMYLPRINGDYETLYIRNQKTRWGSCSSKNNLSFNWRLLMGPEEVLEYVVVHELVHLEHRNHSSAFWDRLSELFPNYEASRNWLKENKHKLVFSKEELLS